MLPKFSFNFLSKFCFLLPQLSLMNYLLKVKKVKHLSRNFAEFLISNVYTEHYTLAAQSLQFHWLSSSLYISRACVCALHNDKTSQKAFLTDCTHRSIELLYQYAKGQGN